MIEDLIASVNVCISYMLSMYLNISVQIIEENFCRWSGQVKIFNVMIKVLGSFFCNNLPPVGICIIFLQNYTNIDSHRTR